MTVFFNGECRTGGFNTYFVVDGTELIASTTAISVGRRWHVVPHGLPILLVTW
jgi:hypothetical protein